VVLGNVAESFIHGLISCTKTQVLVLHTIQGYAKLLFGPGCATACTGQALSGMPSVLMWPSENEEDFRPCLGIGM
ncbi:hypothetical protein KI387_035787, partial [Taxus chinensis]